MYCIALLLLLLLLLKDFFIDAIIVADVIGGYDYNDNDNDEGFE